MAKKELIMGIDDAGRGPLIGPMILASVLLNKEQETILKEAGAKDSKQLTHVARMKLAKIIKENVISYKIAKAFPDEIDYAVSSKENLNTLEAKKSAEVINSLNNGKDEIFVILDCPSVNTNAWRLKLLEFISNKDNLEIVCEHKADANHIAVSAASILAKCAREEEVEKIKKEYSKYGDIGSGYPADPTTKEFLKKHGLELANSGIFRKTWSTWTNMFGSSEDKGKTQASLKDF